MTARDLALMAGNYSAMAADSQSTAASSPIGTMPLPLGQEARRENLAIGWNLEGHQESTQRSRQHHPQAPGRKKTCRPGWRPRLLPRARGRFGSL